MWLAKRDKDKDTDTDRQTHITGLTSREHELNLFVNDFQGYEVMFLVEPAIVEKQSISFSRCKPAETDTIRLIGGKKKSLLK